MAWLCACEYQELFPDSKSLRPGQLRHVECIVTLHDAFPSEHDNSLRAEISEYHCYLVGLDDPGANSTLSKSTVDALLALVDASPSIGLALCEFLVGGDAGLPSLGDQALRHFLLEGELKIAVCAVKGNSCGRAVQLLSGISVVARDLPLENLTPLVSAIAALPYADHSIETVNTGDDDDDAGPMVLSREQVLSCLMLRDSGYMVGLLCAELASSLPQLTATNAVSVVEAVQRNDFWSEYFLFGVRNETHVLEELFKIALALVSQRSFALLDGLLSPSFLIPLRPIVLLTAWGSVNGDIKLAEELLDTLYDPGAEMDSTIRVACELATYQVRLANDCHACFNQDAESVDVAARIFAAVSNSLPETVGRALETLRILSSTVSLGKIADTTLISILGQAPSSGLTAVERDGDVVVARSFCAVKQVLHVLCTFTGAEIDVASENMIRESLVAARGHIEKIWPLTYRTEILECIFSLLFLQHNHVSSEASGADGDFIVTESVLVDLLSFVGDCLGNIQQAIELQSEAYAEAPIDPAIEHIIKTTVSTVNLPSRLARLEQYVQEAQWRLHLIRGNPDAPRGTGLATRAPGERQRSIVRQMLAPPDALLTACLLNRDFNRAQEVISMFGIENEASRDAIFARKLSEITKKMLSRGMPQERQLDELTENMDVLSAVHVYVDLALTVAKSREVCEKLLGCAIAKIESDVSGDADVHSLMPTVIGLQSSMRASDSSLVTILASRQCNPLTSESVKAVIAAETELSNAHNDIDAVLRDTGLARPRTDTVPTGMATTDNFDERTKKVTSLRQIQSTVANAIAALRRVYEPHLLPNQMIDGVTQRHDLVGSIFLQLQCLADVCVEASGLKGEILLRHPLMQLNEDPIHTISRLVLQNELPYDHAEAAATILNLNLVQIIVRSSCVRLQVDNPLSSHDSFTTASLTPGGPKYPSHNAAADISIDICSSLNPTSWDGASRHACTTSCELLKVAIQLLQPHRWHGGFVPFTGAVRAEICCTSEYASFCAATGELAGADLALLTDAERFCCYANVVNLMRIHGYLAFGPPETSASWVSWGRDVKYTFGPLGQICLLQLEHVFLRRSFPIPTIFNGALRLFVEELSDEDPLVELTVTTCNPAVEYAIWSGWAHSPIPTPLTPTTFHSTLHDARTKYLLQHVRMTSAGTILLPQFIRWFQGDFLPGNPLLKDILNYVGSHLPAGSSTHAFIQNAQPKTVSYAAFAFSPACPLGNSAPALHRAAEPSVTTDYLSVSAINTMIQGQDFHVAVDLGAEQVDRLPDLAVKYLAAKAPLVRALASLSEGATSTSSVDYESDQMKHSRVRSFLLRSIAGATESGVIRRLVMYRLNPIVDCGVDLSVQQIQAYLLHTSGPVRHQVCCHILDELVCAANYQMAIELMDTGLLLGQINLDLLLCACLNSETTNHSDSWRTIVRITDKKLGAALVLKYMKFWDVDACVEMLGWSRCHLQAGRGQNEPASREEIEICRQLERMQVYAEMLRLYPGLGSWRDIAEQSDRGEKGVVRELVDSHDFDLARRWAALHGVDEDEIEENYVLMLLDGDEPLRAIQVLDAMEPTVAASVAEVLLPQCRWLPAIVLLVRFLLQSVPDFLPPGRIDELNQVELGCSVLQLLPESQERSLRGLMTKPQRIIEQLLMNKQVEGVAAILAQLDPIEASQLISAESLSTAQIKGGWNISCPTATEKNDQTLSSESPTCSTTSKVDEVNVFYHDLISYYAERSLRSVVDDCKSSKDTSTPCSMSRPAPGVDPDPLTWLTDDDGVWAIDETGSNYSITSTGSRGDGTTQFDPFHDDFMDYTAISAPTETQDQKNPESSTTTRTLDGEWTAVIEDDAQTLLRESFSFEVAPSTTLCLAIVNLYPDSSHSGEVCLYLCSELSRRLAYDQGTTDHYYMINSIRRLLYNAKLKFLDCSAMTQVEVCDAFLGYAELLRMLLSSRCKNVNLLSITDMMQKRKALKLRDQLIDDDKMELAMQVATKCGLDTFDVWSSWGRGELELARYDEAWKKFQNCFSSMKKRGSDKAMEPRQNRLLTMIVQSLESNPCPTTDDILFMQDNLRAEFSEAVTDDAKAQFGSHSHRQASIEQAKLRGRPILVPTLVAVNAVNLGRVSLKSTMNSERFNEATKYLQTYGSPSVMSEFFIKHGFLERACEYLLESDAEPEVFANTVFMLALRQGRFEEIKQCLTNIDPSLERWAPHLTLACKQLSAARKYKVLYDLQVFMRDFNRAGLTSIKFACVPGLTSEERLTYLAKAKDHYSAGIRAAVKAEEAGNSEAGQSKLRLLLSREEISRNAQMVDFQTMLVSFFEEEARLLRQAGDIPTADRVSQLASLNLFGDDSEKAEICVQVIRYGSTYAVAFGLAQSILDFCYVPRVGVFAKAGRYVAGQGSDEKASEFLQHIAPMISDDEWDEVLREMVDVYSDKDSGKQADKLAQRIKCNVAKINAYIACNKLKAAYLVAVRSKLIDEIKRIHQLAVSSNNRGVISICEAYFKNMGNAGF